MSVTSPLPRLRTGFSNAQEVAVDAGRTSHVVHLSLYRTITFFGGAAPEFVIIEVSVVFGLLFLIGVHIATCLLALVYATIVHGAAMWITARDPHMAAIYLRSLRGKDFYPPHTAQLRSAPAVYPSIPTGSA